MGKEEKSLAPYDEGWLRAYEEIRRSPARKIVYVIGPSDSGKTTFCRFLAERFLADGPVAYVDCDPGQSTIGPPTTTGMTLYSPPPSQARTWLRFIGGTSPHGHLLPMLASVKRLVEVAERKKPAAVLIDSSGYVLGRPALEFQFQLIDLLRPSFLVAFQRQYELAPLLKNFRRSRTKILAFPVSSATRIRPPEERRSYREQKFADYFRDAKRHELNWRGLGLHGHIPDFSDPEQIRHRLIALCDRENFVVVLAVLMDLDRETRSIHFYAPDFPARRVASIQFGTLFLQRNGKELPPSRPRDELSSFLT